MTFKEKESFYNNYINSNYSDCKKVLQNISQFELLELIEYYNDINYEIDYIKPFIQDLKIIIEKY